MTQPKIAAQPTSITGFALRRTEARPARVRFASDVASPRDDGRGPIINSVSPIVRAWRGDETRDAKAATGDDALSPRHFHCLRKIATAIDPRPEDFTSLTMFHLVEMDLAQRDPQGNMVLTRRGARLLGSQDLV